MSLRSIPLITFFIALVVCAPARAERNVANDVQAIEHVMDAFQAALIHKDKAAYMDLFFSDAPADIGWQFVSEDVRLAKIRTTKPDAIKARQLPSNTFVALIDEVVATAEPRAEEFSNVKIDTDGDVASVSFDYRFLANGATTNWGREMWQLVRTERGWKIFSVVYSIHDRLSVAGDR